MVNDLEAARKNRERIEKDRSDEQHGKEVASRLSRKRPSYELPHPSGALEEVKQSLPLPPNPELGVAVTAVPSEEKKPTKTRLGPYRKGKLLDQHREEILANRLSIGVRATALKWGLDKSSLYSLIRRWRDEGSDIPDLRGTAGHLGGFPAHKPKMVLLEDSEELRARWIGAMTRIVFLLVDGRQITGEMGVTLSRCFIESAPRHPDRMIVTSLEAEAKAFQTKKEGKTV